MAFIAPAGTPLSLGDLASGALRSLATGSMEHLRRQLCQATARERVWLVSTGRAAMTLALEGMKRAAQDPQRVEVIVPGYTCYSVPAAIERTGLVPRLCDVDPATLSPDLDSLVGIDTRRVLAIVSANLYGLPNALADLEGFARRHGLFMLDDAAQALGARYQGRPAGSFGDAGLCSFDKGKNITTLQGGVLLAGSGDLSGCARFSDDRIAGGIARGHPRYSLQAAALCTPVATLGLRGRAAAAARARHDPLRARLPDRTLQPRPGGSGGPATGTPG